LIELDGIAYQVQSTDENAQSILTAINTLAQERGLKDKQGNDVQFSGNLTNPLYLIIWGCGYIAARLQRLMYGIGCLLNIGSASDRQVLTLADIARVRRYTPTRTVFRAIVYSNAMGSCAITTEHTVTIELNGATHKFHPANEETIPPNSSKVMIFRAEEPGQISITEGLVSSFDDPIPTNFDHFDQAQSVPGRELEPISELRSRILNRRETVSGLDKCQEAIANLDGIFACNIYFNYDAYYSTTVSGLLIPPRHCGIYIIGYSPLVASTYWNYSMAETAGENDPLCVVQDYTAANGQHYPVCWKPAAPKNCWIHVYYRDTLSVVQREEIVADILKLMLNVSIGRSLTTADILGAIRPGHIILGAELSDNSQGNWSYKITPQPGEYFDLQAANITTAQGVS
jgi:hypothetical protein